MAAAARWVLLAGRTGAKARHRLGGDARGVVGVGVGVRGMGIRRFIVFLRRCTIPIRNPS